MNGNGAKVLNVNDRDIPRYVNEELLRQAGFDVVSIATGEEALTMLRDSDFELVLLDVQLPGLDGFDVCRRIKANPATANVAVLLSSSTFVTTRNKVTGLESGADGYLVQPFEASELIATIRALLRTRAAERRASALADELGRAMKVRDEFLAMLGHELRNPIGTIATALHLIGADDAGTRERCIEIVRRQTHNLGRMVDDLLDVARITSGKVALDLQTVDLLALLTRCRDAMAAEVLGTRHGVALELNGESLSVRGDPVRLEQIVTNLLTNAIKYTPSGGKVSIRLTPRGDRAVVEVTDTGIGMDAATLAHVFDVFAQGKQGLDRSRGGLGLGLTVVRRLVELHGGTIGAASEGEGRGSTFTLELPVAAPLPASESQPAKHTPELSHLRVLIVEDNSDACEILAVLLRRTCGCVATASNGRSGCEQALRDPFDVMLVDIGLPELDGYEVARRVVAGLGDKRPLLVAMTGYGQPDDRRRALDVGFDLHMVKPISVPTLMSHLEQLPARGAS
jgi:signal transduction histidine kinase